MVGVPEAVIFIELGFRIRFRNKVRIRVRISVLIRIRTCVLHGCFAWLKTIIHGHRNTSAAR